MEVTGEAERLEGRDGVKTSRENFSTPLKQLALPDTPSCVGSLTCITSPALQWLPSRAQTHSHSLCNPAALETWEIYWRQKIILKVLKSADSFQQSIWKT